MKNAGYKDKEVYKMVDEISNNCDVCKKYKKVPPKCVFGLPRATDFNQSVAMDLHYNDKNLYFHIIDESSHYSNAVIKHPSILIKNFLQKTGSTFLEVLRKYLVIMGKGRLLWKKITDFCKNFNIKISTTPAESPWCNGIYEWHNAILTEHLLKVKENISCPWETALSWTVKAKNYFINVSGFIPH